MKRRPTLFMPTYRSMNFLALVLGAILVLSAPLPAHADVMAAGAHPTVETVEQTAGAMAQEASKPATGMEEEQEAESAGFPQLDTKTYPSQVFWLVVTFALVYFLMSKLALPGIVATLKERRTQREDNLAKAGSIQQEAEKITKTYEAALAEAHDNAQKQLSTARTVANEKLSAENAKFAEQAYTRITAAEKKIQAARQDVLTSLPDLAADIACDIVEKISGGQVNKTEAHKAVAAIQGQKG